MVIAGILLTGCASNERFATLTSGACSAFPRPAYQVRGRTSFDQRWADETTEAGVAGCGWKRPAHRPASMDARPPAAAAVPAIAVEAPPAPAKKLHWYNLLPRPRPKEVEGG